MRFTPESEASMVSVLQGFVKLTVAEVCEETNKKMMSRIIVENYCRDIPYHFVVGMNGSDVCDTKSFSGGGEAHDDVMYSIVSCDCDLSPRESEGRVWKRETSFTVENHGQK